LDQRFIENKLLQRLNEKNISVHCRSVFLQGLLLMEQSKIPNYFQPYQDTLMAFTQLASQLKCTKLTLALAFVVQNQLINKIVIGCCSKNQLDEIITSYHEALNINLPHYTFNQLANEELPLINPSLWCLDD
jgi:aryl-alcohol dehydrogenase-like predicted oxidoreductase